MTELTLTIGTRVRFNGGNYRLAGDRVGKADGVPGDYPHGVDIPAGATGTVVRSNERGVRVRLDPELCAVLPIDEVEWPAVGQPGPSDAVAAECLTAIEPAKDGPKWRSLNTGGSCAALVVEFGGLRLLATQEGVATPRPGEPVLLCLTVGDDEQVCGGEVAWDDFIERTAGEWLAAAAERAIIGARKGEAWPTL